jgi:hypothetical protein
MRRTYNGRGMVATIPLDYMGNVKQAPILLREIHKVMPKMEYHAPVHFAACRETWQGIFGADIRRHAPETESLLVERQPKNSAHNQVYIDLALTDLPEDHAFEGGSRDVLQATVSMDSLKFEQRTLIDASRQAELKAQYRIGDERVIVGGCLHEGEIEIFIKAVRQNKERHQGNAKALLVPCWSVGGKSGEHHPSFAQQQNLRHVFDPSTDSYDILTVTRDGILEDLYSIGDVAIMGGTFTDLGTGQNPLEPAFYGKPIIAGYRWMFNNRAYQGLLEAKLLTSIKQSGSLVENLAQQIHHDLSGRDLTQAQRDAAAFISANQGTAEKFAQQLQQEIYGRREKRAADAQRDRELQRKNRAEVEEMNKKEKLRELRRKFTSLAESRDRAAASRRRA